MSHFARLVDGVCLDKEAARLFIFELSAPRHLGVGHHKHCAQSDHQVTSWSLLHYCPVFFPLWLYKFFAHKFRQDGRYHRLFNSSPAAQTFRVDLERDNLASSANLSLLFVFESSHRRDILFFAGSRMVLPRAATKQTSPSA